jgi:hypothetical protein
MLKPKYWTAIEWIAANDRPENINDDGHVTSCLVSDLFGRTVECVLKDVFQVIEEMKYEKSKS